MDLLKFHHNCFGNRTTGYGVKDLEISQLTGKKTTTAKQCSLMDFAYILLVLNEACMFSL